MKTGIIILRGLSKSNSGVTTNVLGIHTKDIKQFGAKNKRDATKTNRLKSVKLHSP